MNSKPVVAVSGAFDDLRSRDFRFLEEAAKLGSLTALVWSDEAIQRASGRPPKFPEAERLYFLRAIRYVTDARLVGEEVREHALPEISGSHPAAWIVSATEDSAAKKDFCRARGLRYHVVTDDALRGFPDPTPGPLPTNTGRKKIIVTGCYDWFHSGHVRFFEEVSARGDLIVAVGHDANVRLLKGEGRPLFPQEERRYLVGSIRFVTKAIVASGHGWLDAEPDIERLRPDIYAVNEDGDVPEKREYCEQHGIEYLVLKRAPKPGLPKRSSTDLRGY